MLRSAGNLWDKSWKIILFNFSTLNKRLRYSLAYSESYKVYVYPGTRDEKLLDSQIGNLLSSKLGGRIAVEQLINDEKLVLLPLSDIRGFDTSGMNAGIYISEAQNLDIDLMKLTL